MPQSVMNVVPAPLEPADIKLLIKALPGVLQSFATFSDTIKVDLLEKLMTMLSGSNFQALLLLEINNLQQLRSADLTIEIIRLYISCNSVDVNPQFVRLLRLLLEISGVKKRYYDEVYALMGNLLGPIDSVDKARNTFPCLYSALKMLKVLTTCFENYRLSKNLVPITASAKKKEDPQFFYFLSEQTPAADTCHLIIQDPSSAPWLFNEVFAKLIQY